MRWIAANASLDGVTMDIIEQGVEVLGVLDRFALISVLEEVPDALVGGVEIDGIRGHDALHDTAEFNAIRLDQEVDMVIHDAVGIEEIVRVLDHVSIDVAGAHKMHDAIDCFVIFWLFEDALFVDATEDDMIDVGAADSADFACHNEE